MAGISPKEARAYFSRWALVHEVEVGELRRTSIETKLRQLEALFASSEVFGADPDLSVEDRRVEDRWVRIRRALSA